ncbi:MAG: CPBP family intramembrane glutamic endopeptidase [Christensenella sp.]|nr:CPBP family intramembrane glutamic endopeptidase [Christensenella sp.]
MPDDIKKQVAFFPDKFGACYWIGTGIYAGLFILTPVLTQEADLQSFILLFYGSMVVPLFEEIIFRGLLWNGLQKVIGRAWVVYLVTSALFALWHLGYVDSLVLHTEENLSNVLFWKAIVGLFYGLVLGVLRLKTKNCYSTFLLHGILNIFGR